MKKRTLKIKEQFIKENKYLQVLVDTLFEVSTVICSQIQNGNKILVCGNGGSCAAADHIVGELMKGFALKRPVNKKDEIFENLQLGIATISLNAHQALISAISNDLGADEVYAQQVLGYGKEGDIFIGLSTSGNSENVNVAMEVANKIGLITIGMTGKNKTSKLSKLAKYCIYSPKEETYEVQEDHIKIYHFLCLIIESELMDY
ncbi:MAG: SIS domain-containing protein [Breznakia sp.]